MKHLSRRSLLRGAAGSGAFLCLSGLLPLWAQSAARGNWGVPSGTANSFNLDIDRFPVRIDGRSTTAVGINGTLPGPLIRFREGDDITLNVTNRLAEDTSIHWHGLLVPFHMDGVPGVSFPGIKPGETFSYRFAVPQSGTYWYHSHSGMQEQLGHYGPIIIDPKDADPVQCDREYVLILGDWTFKDPHRIFAKLKKNAESLNFQRRTVGDLVDDISENGLSDTIADRAMWGRMRMSSTDWADVTGATYTYVINGHSTADNWNGVFRPGERVRLRIINAAAMSIFNFRIPGLPMTVVASDGLNVQPIETDEFQIGVAETYDVIVEPREEKAYAMVAESIDRSGQVVATLGQRPGMRAEEPKIRKPVPLTMKDMGMDHSAMSGMDHSKMDHAAMGHSTMTTQGDTDNVLPTTGANIQRGPGVVNIAAAPASRLDEPGHGLADVPHRALRYAQLRSLDVNPDLRQPEREIELHLTSNMERYMWSFDGKRYSEVDKPIVFYEGERLRLTMVNDTMMPHPIHLHGMFFDVVNDGDDHKPRKHTIIVKPGEKLSVDISADHVGDWAFHCHLLYHMEAGMFQVVSVLPESQMPPHMRRHRGNSEPDQRMKKEADHKHMHYGHGDKAESETGGRK